MDIIVIGTAEYQWALRPFAFLFQKFWPNQKVVWYGDRVVESIPDGIEFRRVPCYSEGVWPWTPWFSNGLRSILADLDSFIVAIFLPDHWISKRVDLSAVMALHNYMDWKGTVLRGNITAGTCLDGYGQHVATRDGHEIVSVGPDHGHCGLHGGITFCPSLWNRALLRDILEPHWNLWQTEAEGTKRMIKFAPYIFSAGVKPGPVHRCHGLFHSQPKTVSLEGLEPEDAAIVKTMIPEGYKCI